jgi:pimeloyl-ACP methyl ester carboxylesterase
MKLSVQGREVYAYTGGKPFDPALPCLVFVHGALHDHSVWTLLARWCAHHGYGVLALDLPGHARSAGPPPADVESAGAWLLAVLDAAGVQHAVLVGHSVGSLMALEAAAQAPERVSRLVMISTAFPMKVSDALLKTGHERPLDAIDMVNAFSISGQASKPSHPGPGSWLHGGNRVLMRQTLDRAEREQGINLFVHDFALCDRYAGGLAAAERVRCPVHFILGTSDQMTLPKASTTLAAALQAQVTTLASGHHLMAEVPDAVLNALRTALTSDHSRGS